MKKTLYFLFIVSIIFSTTSFSRIRLKGVKITLSHKGGPYKGKSFGKYNFRFKKLYIRSRRHGKFIKGFKLLIHMTGKRKRVKFYGSELTEGVAKTVNFDGREIEIEIYKLINKHGPRSNAYRTVVIKLSIK